MTAPILIVEDEPMQRQMLATLIQRKLGYDTAQAEHGRQALDILRADTNRDIRLVILDLKMPVLGGIETLQIIRQQYPDLPVIMLSGSRDTEDAALAIKHGATDFLSKPYDGERLRVTVQNTLKLGSLSQELSLIKSEQAGQMKFSQIIGHDHGLAPSILVARKAALSDIPIFITGETGTGKEVLAKAIHGESMRAGKAFIAVNCGALPAQLVESILFGHEKGAFTGAVQKSLGKFREAEGGTLFLDEIGDLPLDAQVKLLRVLQQKEVEPIGAAQSIPVNVRVISATHQDLEQAVAQGRFREDLYFRLNVLKINLPSLRDRRADIPLLARHFLMRFCAAENRPLKTLSKASDELLMRHQWAGNVRQLENVIHRALVLSDGTVIEPADLTASLGMPSVTNTSHEQTGTISPFHPNGCLKTCAEVESEMIGIALHNHKNNITQAAAALGMAKSTFYKKISQRD